MYFFVPCLLRDSENEELFLVEQAFVGRDEIRAPPKTPALEASPKLSGIV